MGWLQNNIWFFEKVSALDRLTGTWTYQTFVVQKKNFYKQEKIVVWAKMLLLVTYIKFCMYVSCCAWWKLSTLKISCWLLVWHGMWTAISWVCLTRPSNQPHPHADLTLCHSNSSFGPIVTISAYISHHLKTNRNISCFFRPLTDVLLARMGWCVSTFRIKSVIFEPAHYASAVTLAPLSSRPQCI